VKSKTYKDEKGNIHKFEKTFDERCINCSVKDQIKEHCKVGVELNCCGGVFKLHKRKKK